MHDIVVVGGGPGGLHAARCLASRGIDVRVLEEHPEIGSPVHCTGVLAPDAFAEFDIPSEARLNDLDTVRFLSPGGLSVDYTTREVEAVVIDRMRFDRSLAARARAAGAVIECGVRVQSIDPDRSGVTVGVSNGAALRARAVVLACGANYTFQRRLGLGMPRAFMQSAQAELPCAEPGVVEVGFGSNVAPGGFAWAVPVVRPGGSFVRLGLMADANAEVFYREAVARAADAWGIDPALRDAPPRRRMLPLAPITRTYADRIVAVGDAAGLVKATTGGGIYYSLMTGALAADVLAESLTADRLEARHLASYESRWRARCGAELDAQLRLRKAAERMSDAQIDHLFELSRTEGLTRVIRRTARFNSHRPFVLALFRYPPVRKLLLGRLGLASGVA